MSHAHQPPAADAVVDLYPAGASYSHGHHGHVIVPKRVLLTVLGVLMFFTLLTVGAAQAEQWISHTFDVVIPQWVNVAVALSIATIKSIIVVMFFMQLKYDSPLNSIVMGFTFFAVGLFFFFTMIDLGNRDAIYPYKSGEIQRGGMGINNQKTDPKTGKVLSGVNTANKPITVWAAEARLEKIRTDEAAGTLNPRLAPGETAEQRFEKERAEAHAHARGGHKHHDEDVSTASKSRAPKPVGPELYADKKAAPAHDSHGGH